MLAFLSIALAAVPLELQIVASPETNVEVAIIRADGAVAWRLSTSESQVVHTDCVPGGSVRASLRTEDGKVLTTTTPLRSVKTDLGCEVAVSCCGVDSPPDVFVSRRTPLPAAVKVRVENADDSTGLGTLVIENGTKETLAIQTVTIDADLVPGWEDCGPASRWGEDIAPKSTVRVKMQERLCARSMNATPHRRVVGFAVGSTRFEARIPFTPKPFAPVILFPDEPSSSVTDMVASSNGWRISLSGKSACACGGERIGVERELVALPPSPAAASTWDWRRRTSLPAEAGDFPEYPPYYGQPGKKP